MIIPCQIPRVISIKLYVHCTKRAAISDAYFFSKLNHFNNEERLMAIF